MAKRTAILKSPVEQIMDTMFAIIEKQEGFGSETIQKLKQLSLHGDLTKKPIIKIIRESSGEHHETA